MKIATWTDVEDIYNRLEPLAREVFDIPYLPDLRMERNLGISLAITDFWDSTRMMVSKSAQYIGVSEKILGLTYMDEMEMILRHEIAHVAAGLEAAHGWEWKDCCVKFETMPEPVMTLRHNKDFASRVGAMSLSNLGTLDAREFNYSWM